MNTADTQQLAALSLMMMGISFLVGIGVYVWYAAMFAKVLKRFGQPAWSAWVPVYNEMQLFKIGGQQPWLALLLYVPLAQIVGIVFKVFALHRISQQSWRGIGTTVLGVLLPPVWATVLAFGPSPDPEQGRMAARGTPPRDIPPVAPTGPLAGAPGAPAPGADGWFLSQPGAAPAPIVPPAPSAAAPTASVPSAAAPSAGPQEPAAASWSAPAAPAAGSAGAAAPCASAVAAPVAPSADQGTIGTTGGSSALASLFAPPSDAPPAGPVEPPARIGGRIEPLPPAPVTPPPATIVPPVAAPAVPAPASAPAASAPAAPAPGAPVPAQVVAAPLPSLPVAPPPGFVAPAAAAAPAAASVPAAAAAAAAPIVGYDPADAETIVTGDGDDDPFDRTVVVTRRPVVPWRLVLDDGTPLALDAVVVVLGRNPREALTGEQRLVVPDPSRTLSKTHAVLRLEGDEWAITDLDSTNGVMVPDASGVDQLVDAGVPTPVRNRFVLGTLAVRLERTGETPGGR